MFRNITKKCNIFIYITFIGIGRDRKRSLQFEIQYNNITDKSSLRQTEY